MPPKCRCGHESNHHMVSPEGEYGVWGWVLMIVGATPTPVRIKYRCRNCDQIIAVSDDLEVRRKHR